MFWDSGRKPETFMNMYLNMLLCRRKTRKTGKSGKHSIGKEKRKGSGGDKNVREETGEKMGCDRCAETFSNQEKINKSGD